MISGSSIGAIETLRGTTEDVQGSVNSAFPATRSVSYAVALPNYHTLTVAKASMAAATFYNAGASTIDIEADGVPVDSLGPGDRRQLNLTTLGTIRARTRRGLGMLHVSGREITSGSYSFELGDVQDISTDRRFVTILPPYVVTLGLTAPPTVTVRNVISGEVRSSGELSSITSWNGVFFDDSAPAPAILFLGGGDRLVRYYIEDGTVEEVQDENEIGGPLDEIILFGGDDPKMVVEEGDDVAYRDASGRSCGINYDRSLPFTSPFDHTDRYALLKVEDDDPGDYEILDIRTFEATPISLPSDYIDGDTSKLVLSQTHVFFKHQNDAPRLYKVELSTGYSDEIRIEGFGAPQFARYPSLGGVRMLQQADYGLWFFDVHSERVIQTKMKGVGVSDVLRLDEVELSNDLPVNRLTGEALPSLSFEDVEFDDGILLDPAASLSVGIVAWARADLSTGETEVKARTVQETFDPGGTS